MTTRIITPPPVPEDRFFKHQCNSCLCVFEFTADEVQYRDWTHYTDYGTTYRVACPACKSCCAIRN